MNITLADLQFVNVQRALDLIGWTITMYLWIVIMMMVAIMMMDLPLHTDRGQVDDAGEGSEHLHVADHLADGGSLVDAGVHLPPQVQGDVQEEEEEVSQGEAGEEEAGVVTGMALPPAHYSQGHGNGRVSNYSDLCRGYLD